jgi:7-alpha-hydroxysteroid dehydrogenase
MILDRFKLTDKIAIVTGAGKGIGRGIALAFAEAGADVVCAARTKDEIEDTASEVRARGRRALAVPTDVIKTEDLEELVAATVSEFGRIDVLVNNAGGTGPRAALETTEGYFERAIRMNVTQAFLLSKLAIPIMVETAGGGAIVNISSRASDMVQTSFVAYGAGKAALNMMTRNFAAEVAPKVRINAISVGGVATQGLEVVLTNDALREQFERNTPMGRPGSVEDIASAALFLASPASGWTTGKIFQVDGGTEAPAMSVPVKPL